MTIKAYFSNQTGAPVLSGTVGSLVSVLDACLVNGYNQVSVTSVARSGSTVTVTCSASHGYENPTTTFYVQNGVVNVATIAGCNETAYNGDWPVTYVSDTVFQFDIGTATPSSPATGTITTKRAAGGWSKAFADTNRGVYRSNDLTSRRHYMYITDVADCPNGQGARYAGVRGFEQMTGIDSWSYPFPTVVNAGWAEYILKSNALDSTSRHWSLYTDGKTVIMCIHNDQVGGTVGTLPPYSIYSYVWGFGDLLTPVPDAYGTFVSALSSNSSSPTASGNSGLTFPSNTNTPNINTGSGWNCIARSFNSAPRPVWAAGLMGHGLPTNTCMGATQYQSYPDLMSNRMYLVQLQMYEPNASVGAVLRGVLPIYESPHGLQHQNREIVANVTGREGRKFQFIRSGVQNSSAVGGVYIDLSGDPTTGKWS